MLTTIYAQGKELFPLTEATIRGLHHELLRHYPKAEHHLGQYKTSPNQVVSVNNATGERRIVLDPAPPGPITSAAMADLVGWYNETIKEHPWPLLVATEFVFRFLAIHPFQDGNGRLGRGLFLLAGLQSDDKYLTTITPYIAIDRHIEQNRPLYYTVMHQCSEGKFRPDSKEYKLEPLAWFFLKVVESSLSDITYYRQKYNNLQKLSETALAVLDCFKASPERRLQIAEIEKETGLPRRTIQYVLKTLIDQGFLQVLGQGGSRRYQLIF
jgi:Fic family protein